MLLINDPAQLPRLISVGPRTRFQIALPDRSAEENQLLEQQLRRAVRDCGCVEATVALAGGIGISVAAWLLLPNIPIWLLIVSPLALMFTAKWAARHRAQKRLREIVNTVLTHSSTNI